MERKTFLLLIVHVEVIYQNVCYVKIPWDHSHKTQKANPRTLVSRLSQNTSNVNITSTRKSKQMYYLCDQLLLALIYLYFIVLILICF